MKRRYILVIVPKKPRHCMSCGATFDPVSFGDRTCPACRDIHNVFYAPDESVGCEHQTAAMLLNDRLEWEKR